MKVEFISYFEALPPNVWLKSFILILRVMDPITNPLRIVFMIKNHKSGSPNKHIDIKYLTFREHVKEKKKAIIDHVGTELKIVNYLTKGMPPISYTNHIVRMDIGFFYLENFVRLLFFCNVFLNTIVYI